LVGAREYFMISRICLHHPKGGDGGNLQPYDRKLARIVSPAW
jgi:hypothetical protein